ncbi:MAG: 4Fe-4S binding protein [Rhizobiales bacterium]|nr:4Fe-4S binding protein [Hyphomicrobiales bacterium]
MGEVPRLLICNCEKSMVLDGAAIGKALGTEALRVHSNLCRMELAAFEKEAGKDGALIVACTQEAPLFSEIIDEGNLAAEPRYVNIRERAGWCAEPQNANAKIAALLAEAMIDSTPVRLRSIKSDGLCLVYGRGQAALEAARQLSPRLSVTLVLSDASDVILPQTLDFTIYQGRMKKLSGALGGFDVVLDNYASMLPSSRREPAFTLPKNDAKSRCSLVLDLSGGVPMLTGHSRRDGYVHVDPENPLAIMRAVFDLSDMVGEFEKPIYVDYNGAVCAHARNQKTGCSKCLDVCPAGAIGENGDLVAIDALICGGCGSCHAVCPTGAISYNYPQRSDILKRLFTLGETFLKAGGRKPALLVHDESFGTPLIDAMARFGRGLPGNVIPFMVHSPTVFGHTEILAAFAGGFGAVVVLNDPRKAEELTGLQAEIALSEAVLAGLRLSGTITLSTETDPDLLERDLAALLIGERVSRSFQPLGDKRTLARLAIGKLAEGTGVEAPIPLPEAAPYGRVDIDLDACTLCMSCVSVCPANAMFDTPNTPELRFVEHACVQCSLCVKTCPEKALTLVPQLDWSAGAMQPVTLKKEEPFECIRCGTPFATQSTIRRISQQLADKHSMFVGTERSALIEMCADCRIEAQADSLTDPFALGARPRIRTTDDYLESSKQGLSIDDFFIKK